MSKSPKNTVLAHKNAVSPNSEPAKHPPENTAAGGETAPAAPAVATPALPALPSPAPPATPPLRLEWIEAGQLAENPNNWRRHSAEQIQSIKELVSDPQIGWAGACLYNERTKRLIDGHGRRSAVDPKALVPVLVGNWSEESESKILATLDPVGDMAIGDAEAYQRLIADVEFDSLWLRDLVQAQGRAIQEGEESLEETEETGAVQPESLQRMELEPFEHYDYVIVLAKNVSDWEQLVERLGIKKADCSRRIGTKKIGLGRAVDPDTREFRYTS